MSEDRTGVIRKDLEWMVANGSGIFALGCVDRVPRRKYHTLYSIADGLGPDSLARNLLLDVFEKVVGTHVANPRGTNSTPCQFSSTPTPTWLYQTDSFTLARSLEMRAEEEMPQTSRPSIAIAYTLAPKGGKKTAAPQTLELEPWLLSRPLHVEMKLNTALWGSPLQGSGQNVWRFQLYPHEPIIRITWKGVTPNWVSNGRWETDLIHEWEAERGYASTEDVFVPGRFSLPWDGNSTLKFSLEVEWECVRPVIGESELTEADKTLPGVSIQPKATAKTEDRSFKARLAQAANTYAAAIHEGSALTPSLLAGFPWFGPWGRDTLISIPGYALATKRSHHVYGIMAAMGRRIRDGLLQGTMGSPDMSHRSAAAVNFHGVDTPLLFVWALEHLHQQRILKDHQVGVLRELASEIIASFAQGSYPGVQVTPDGRVHLATGLWAPTWMDARVEDHPVTPRHGEPIEINALFASALSYLVEFEDDSSRLPDSLRELAQVASKNLATRYWNSAQNYFADTRETDGIDAKIRPNQLWLIALSRIDVPAEQARAALNTIKKELLTPVGLRTLSSQDSQYKKRCHGNQRERDLAYHQGTVWPWLLGILGDALIRFEGIETARSSLAPCLTRLQEHLDSEGCIGHLSEIFDGDKPHAPRGAPAQAWSVMELYRLMEALSP